METAKTIAYLGFDRSFRTVFGPFSIAWEMSEKLGSRV